MKEFITEVWGRIIKPIWIDVASLWAGVTLFYLFSFDVYLIAILITAFLIVRVARKEYQGD